MPRFSAVPWLADTDLAPMGAPETSVEMPDDITLGLLICDPFGKDSDAMLAIRAQRGNGNDGGDITLSIGSVVERVTVNIDINLQSNPHRGVDE